MVDQLERIRERLRVCVARQHICWPLQYFKVGGHVPFVVSLEGSKARTCSDTRLNVCCITRDLPMAVAHAQ